MNAIRRLLIINRGEVALRVQTAARRLGIQTIGIFTPDDTTSTHVKAFDVLYEVGSYTDQQAILKIVKQHGIDAIHPGYGFLSENPDFAAKVIELGVIWVGPNLKAIQTLSCKASTTQLAKSLGVPILTIDKTKEQLTSDDFPLMIKARAGGGGRAMCPVLTKETFEKDHAFVLKEAKQIFDDESIIFESYKEDVRHIEVQVLGDQHGHIIHVLNRDCTVQRRNQKVIEQAPALGIDSHLMESIYTAALSLAKALKYDSLGTFEFLVDPIQKAFWLIEGNPRLQVEHGVTEAITGIDLVTWQLKVASGAPLTLQQAAIQANGHAVQARVYAENPYHQGLPSVGLIRSLQFSHHPNAQFHWSIQSGSQVTTTVDPMLGKIIVHSEDYHSAINTLGLIVSESFIAGIMTNLSWIGRLVMHQQFIENDYHIKTFSNWVERENEYHSPTLIGALIFIITSLKQSPYALMGWTNRGQRWSIIRLKDSVQSHSVYYQVKGEGHIQIEGLGNISIMDMQPESIQFSINGEVSRVHFFLEDNQVFFKLGHDSHQCQKITFDDVPVLSTNESQSTVFSVIPGVIVDIVINENDTVQKGQHLFTIEAMKMHHEIKSPCQGVLKTLNVRLHQVIDVTDLMATIEPVKALSDERVCHE